MGGGQTFISNSSINPYRLAAKKSSRSSQTIPKQCLILQGERLLKPVPRIDSEYLEVCQGTCQGKCAHGNAASVKAKCDYGSDVPDLR